MSYGVMIPLQIAAQNVDAWNRSAVNASLARENGDIFALLTKSATTNETEVWTATVPATSGSHLTDLWMAYDPELVWTGSYRGLDPDVRNFYIPATKVFSAFLLKPHDLLLMDADCFSGANDGTDLYANAADSTWQLVWGDSQTSVSQLCLKWLTDGSYTKSYISIGTGGIDTQRIDAYTMEVISV
jgi:hypothetical protein